MINEEIQLSEEQQKLFNAMEFDNKNLFISGKAGTGKSHVIKYFLKHTKKTTAHLAYTGIAALNIGGSTINKFFGILSHGVYNPDEQIKHLDNQFYIDNLREKFEALDCLIIDEISMVRVDLFHTMDMVCRHLRDDDRFFGGIQVFLVGDMFQLPPVTRDPNVREFIKDTYSNVYFFNYQPEVLNNVRQYKLKEIHRQSDEKFKRILNNIRIGKVSQEDLNELNKRVTPPPSMDGVITLTGRNDSATAINESRLKELPGESKTFSAVVEGDIKESSYPTDLKLKLKVGAQVMMLNNDPFGLWVNGSIGTITSLTGGIKVKINGIVCDVDKYTWTSKKYTYNRNSKSLEQESTGSFTQYPIKLAWAITIHKSQGQTYDSVYIDMGRAFDYGQVYVALSRCKSLDTLYLARPIYRSSIKVDEDILKYLGEDD